MVCSVDRYFAVLVLVGYVLLHGIYHRIPVDGSLSSWSGENYHTAVSISQGKGFANPFPDLETGPSAWVAPTFPYVLAGIFSLGGPKSPAAARLCILLQVLLFATTLWLLHAIVNDTFSTVAAKLATLIWLFSPNRIGLTSTYFLSEVGFTTFSILLAILGLVRFKNSPTRNATTLAGLAIGFAILCLPIMVLALPFYARALSVLGKTRPTLARVAPILACAVSLAVVTPWLVRNYLVFREFVFIKSNMGQNLYQANSDEGDIDYSDYPADRKLLREMGEINYNHYSIQRAAGWIRTHKRQFLERTARRVITFWVSNPSTGLKRAAWTLYQILLLAAASVGLWRHWRRNAVTTLCSVILLIVPSVYYLTAVVDYHRYRLPFEALLTMFASAGWDRRC